MCRIHDVLSRLSFQLMPPTGLIHLTTVASSIVNYTCVIGLRRSAALPLIFLVQRNVGATEGSIVSDEALEHGTCTCE